MSLDSFKKKTVFKQVQACLEIISKTACSVHVLEHAQFRTKIMKRETQNKDSDFEIIFLIT